MWTRKFEFETSFEFLCLKVEYPLNTVRGRICLEERLDYDKNNLKETSGKLLNLSSTSALNHQHSSVLIHQHSSVLIHQHSSVLIYQHSSVLIHQHSSVLIHQHSSVLIHQHSSVLIHQHVSVHIHQHSTVISAHSLTVICYVKLFCVKTKFIIFYLRFHRCISPMLGCLCNNFSSVNRYVCELQLSYKIWNYKSEMSKHKFRRRRLGSGQSSDNEYLEYLDKRKY